MYIINILNLAKININRPVFLLALGGGIGPFFQLLAIHSLARLYSPNDFGNLALFMSMAGVLISISCLRYEFTITKVDEDYEAASTWLAFFAVLFTFLVIILLLVINLPIIFFPQIKDLGMRLWEIPIFCLCGGIILVGLQTTLRRAKFALNAFFRSAQTIIFITIALFFNSINLIDSAVIGSIFIALIIFLYLYKTTPIVPFKEVRSLAKEFIKYPIYLVPTTFFDSAALAAPVFFISMSYGFETTGSYFQIQKITGAPLVLAAMVASQLFLKISSEACRAGKPSRGIFWKYFSILTIISLVIILFLYIGGEYIFTKLLGQGWRVDGYFLVLVTIPLVARLSVSPMSTVFITYNCVNLLSKWQFGYLFSTITVLYWASAVFSFDVFLIIFALHEILLYLIYLYMGNFVSQKVK